MQTSFFARLGLAMKVIFSRRFTESLLTPVEVPAEPEQPIPAPVTLTAPNTDGALQLIALLQKEGRLIDFIQEDITAFDDAQIGAAARVVHQGLRKVIHSHVDFAPVADKNEGDAISLPADFDSHSYRLTGNITGQGPFNGTLIHKGWRAVSIEMPQTVAGYDFSVVAPAEVEV